MELAIVGVRAQRSAWLMGSVSAIALAQVLAAGGAGATAGPCSTDTATMPGTTIVTCTGAITGTGAPAISYAANQIDIRWTAGSPTAEITTTGNAAQGIFAKANIGNASVTSTGNVTTTGENSHGVAALTFTGSASLTSTGNITTSGDNSSALIASAETGASVTSIGNVSTSGQSATPIHASAATGDVQVASTGNISSIGFASGGIYASATAGHVTVTSTGDVTVTGDSSVGIAAGAHGGSASLTSTGNISVTGAYSVGIDVQASIGDASATINGGKVSSALDLAVNVLARNTATLENHGTIAGNVVVKGGSSSTFNNNVGGIFDSGDTVELESNGILTNAGTVSPGGVGTIRTTALTGNFVQTSTGVLKVDADWTGNAGAGAADLLAVSGTATLAGTVIVNPLNFPTTGGLTKQFTVLTAAGGITDNGISIANTAAVNYALLYPDANTMNVQATINFQGVGLNNLNPNQNSVGGNLNTVLGAGTNLGFMPALMQLPSGGGLGGALNQLAPIGDGGTFSTAMTTGAQFGQQLLSCRIAGEEGEVNRFIEEGQCVWARVNARRLDNDGRADGVGYRENALFYSAGAQLAVARDWRIGGGIGYETLNLSTDSSASSQGERLHLGGVVKYNPGPWLLAAGVTGGWGWHDNRRNVSFGGFGATATSDSETSFVASRLTMAYLMARGAFYAKPQLELAVTHLMRDSYTETGTGGIALSVARSSDTVLSASPSLELGAETRSSGGLVTRAFIKGGVTFRDTDTFVTTATFADAPGAPAFAITSKVDKTVADIGAGLDLISAGGSALRLQYDGQYGDRTTQHSGGAKLQLRF